MSIVSNDKNPLYFSYNKNKEEETSREKDKITNISKQAIPTEINTLSPIQELKVRGSTQESPNQVHKTVLSAAQSESTSVQSEQEFSKEKIAQLKEIFHLRYVVERKWRNTHYKHGCEQFAYYLLTGKIGQLQNPEKHIPSIKELELGKLKEIQHKPYTVYAIYAPRTPAMTKAMGQYWAFQHYYMHLENNLYVSTNGLGPITVFKSYEKMLKKDAFPKCIGTLGRFSTKDGEPTNDIDQALIGEAEVGTIH
jgi:hypothetical protein